MYCGANDEEVRIAQEQYYPNMIYTSTRHYEHDEPEHFRNTKGYEHYVETAEKLRDGRALRSEQDDTQVIGTPEQCLEKLRRIQSRDQALRDVRNGEIRRHAAGSGPEEPGAFRQGSTARAS